MKEFNLNNIEDLKKDFLKAIFQLQRDHYKKIEESKEKLKKSKELKNEN